MARTKKGETLCTPNLQPAHGEGRCPTGCAKMREKLRLAKMWATDGDANVRRWATEMIGYIEECIRYAELQEI